MKNVDKIIPFARETGWHGRTERCCFIMCIVYVSSLFIWSTFSNEGNSSLKETKLSFV